MAKNKRWRFAAGPKGKGARVTVYERRRGGNVYAKEWDPTLRGGAGWYRVESLRFAVRDADGDLIEEEVTKAETYALDRAAKLRAAVGEPREELTLRRLFDIYRSRKGSINERRVEMWTRVLGADADPHRITEDEMERFARARLSGALNPRGEGVADEEKRRPVRQRTVEADVNYLKRVLNWGTKSRDAGGHFYLRENPLRGYVPEKERNPRRPVATHDRFLKIRAVSDQILVEVIEMEDGKRKRRKVRSPLSALLDLVNGTGRRISAVCQLRYADLRLGDGPHGAIRWPEDTDKMGYEFTTPIGPDVRAALDQVLADRLGIGDAYLFPAPRDPSKPVSKDLASKWLRKAEELAAVEPMKGSLWHAYRRKWATERKHLPDKDVAAAGGWKDTRALTTAYQQVDPETVLEVVLNPKRLRDAR